VAGGRIDGSTYSNMVEVIDTTDTKNSLCQNLPNLPTPIYGGVGTINNYLNAPLICAGKSNSGYSIKICQAFQNGIWSNLPKQLNDDRYSSSYVELKDSQVSISSTFNLQLLLAQIPNVQKRQLSQQYHFAFLGPAGV